MGWEVMRIAGCVVATANLFVGHNVHNKHTRMRNNPTTGFGGVFLLYGWVAP